MDLDTTKDSINVLSHQIYPLTKENLLRYQLDEEKLSFLTEQEKAKTDGEIVLIPTNLFLKKSKKYA